MIIKRQIPIRGHCRLQEFMADITLGRISPHPQSLYTSYIFFYWLQMTFTELAYVLSAPAFPTLQFSFYIR